MERRNFFKSFYSIEYGNVHAMKLEVSGSITVETI